MEIKRLNSDVISKIRSSFNINSVAQCVFELVCNSLDAKSTSIAVRINLITFKIQVADNGEGITKENLELLGIRYMTNKCHQLGELEKYLNTYGFRGETLASIVEMCKGVSISSRCNNSSETYSKTLSKDLRSEVKLTKHRSSVGTTVTILGFLSNFPVRQQRVVQEIELEEVKRYIERLIIINPGSSFSLRNDVTGLLILNSPKNSDIIGSFRHLHPDIADLFTLLKVSKNKVSIDALIHKEFIISKKFQYIYVNKRPVISHKILKNVNNSFYKKMELKTKRSKHPIFETKRYPVYVLNIKCPQCYVDIFMGPSKSDVEFKCWDLVLACIEKIIKTFFGLDDEKEKKITPERKRDARLTCGVSQVLGAVQACAYKRKSDEAIVADGEDNFKINNDDSLQKRPVCIKKRRLPHLNEKKKAPSIKGDKNKQLKCFVKDKTTYMSNEKAESLGNYQIEDSGKQKQFLKPRKLKSIIKKPLPIRVDLESKLNKLKTTTKPDKAKQFDLADSIRPEDTCLDHQIIPKYQFDQKSVYSRLNNDEDQGKNLIMDMFLKSTQVFTGDDGKSQVGEKACPDISGETIEESNFVMENNIQDTIRGINATMSISVNVKKKRMAECKKKVSKYIQTSIIQERSDNMMSKCVQTSQRPSLERVRSNLSDLAHQFDGFKLSHEYREDEKDNYTILINTVRKKREFRFVRKSEEMDVDSSEEKNSFRLLKICHCREDDGKIFKFNQSLKPEVLSLNDRRVLATTAINENLFETHCRQEMTNINDNEINRNYCINKERSDILFKKPRAPVINEPKPSIKNQQCHKIRRKNLNFHGIKKQTSPKIVEYPDACEKSPFFSKKNVPQTLKLLNNNLEQGTSYKVFQKKFKSAQLEDDFDYNLNAIRNSSSPYFVRNCREDNVLPQKTNVYLAGTIGDYFEPHNGNNRIQSEGFPMQRLNLPHPHQYHLPSYHNVEQNYLKMANNPVNQNMCCMQHVNDYGGHPSTRNFLPRFCCHENIGPPEIGRQYFGIPEDNRNDLRPQNCNMQTLSYYKGDMRYMNNGNFNMEPRDGNICLHSNLNFHEHRDIARNTRIQVPEFHDNVEINESTIVEHKGKHKKERQTAQPVEVNEQNFSLEEVPWYTPNVSDENMYFERPSSELMEMENASSIGELQNLSTDQHIREFDEQENKIVEEKTFNFKFTCTPNIFSSETIAERSSKINKKTLKNKSAESVAFFGALEKNGQHDLKEAVKDIPQDGIVDSKDAVRMTNTMCSSKEGSDLEITVLDDQEKQNLIEKELGDVRKNNGKRFFSCASGVKIDETKNNEEKSHEKSRIIVDSQNEWVKKYNPDGKGFYVNRRTGMVTTSTPKIDEGFFVFDKRLDFVPKGMSPVLKEHKKIDRSLSQNAKTKLHDFILEGYENELMVIKWQHFIYDDPKTFFEEIYKEKSKQFENVVPSIHDGTIKNNFQKDMVGFDGKMFKTIEFIGQVDRKFIAVLEKTKKIVILFDQHAVHERIRVEQFLKEYKGLRTSCKEKLTFFMPRIDLGLLKKHSAYLSSLGLDVEFFTDGLKIVNIPLCVQEKFHSQDNTEELSRMINTLLKEIIENLKETRGATSQLPKIIHNIINLKACRGAIKFGDNLTKEDCVKLLKDLEKCKLPFQCAHGRPTLTPVLTLSKIEFRKKNSKLNLKKLL